MELLTDNHKHRLHDNWRINRRRIEATGRTVDFKPVVKLFTPWRGFTWLLSEMDPDDPQGHAFGLCDLGMGCPELGYVDVEELRRFRGPFGIRIERDLYFVADKTLAEYADEARIKGRIAA